MQARLYAASAALALSPFALAQGPVPLGAAEVEAPYQIDKTTRLEPLPSDPRLFASSNTALDLTLSPLEPLGSFSHLGGASGTLAITSGEEGFESGSLDSSWETASSTADGRIRILDQFGAAEGTFALLMDTAVNGPQNLNEATWTVDLSGLTSATLQFAHADFNDEETAFGGPFTGSFDADGIAISADGTNWFPVFDAPSQPAGQWVTYNLDLAAAAANAGIALGADFKIRFQQYDNFSLTTDGRGWDAISILSEGFDVDEFTFTVDPGQQITLVVEPGASVQPEVTLLRSSAVLASNTAAAAGEKALIQVVPTNGVLAGPGGAAQTYTVRVSGVTQAIGDYDLVVLLNSAVEAEANGGPTNDSPADAEDLDAHLVALASATSSSPRGPRPERASVIGALGSTALDGDGFESGSLGSQWSTASSDPNGRIRVTGDFGTASGSFALLMDRSPNGTFTLNEAIWTVDLSGRTAAILEFAHAEYADETHNFSGPFVGSFDADGVAISGDGVNWFPVLDMPNQATGVWERYSVDLADAAAQAGIPLGAGFQIKFQQYDNFALSTDGRGWDDISINTATTDHFSVSLEAGESLTVGATALTGSSVGVELLDAAGNVVAGGASSAFANGGFESGDFTGWVREVSGEATQGWHVSSAGAAGGYGFLDTRPAEGRFGVWHAFDGQGPLDYTLHQDVRVDAHGGLLTWRERIQWDFAMGGTATQPRTHEVLLVDPMTGATLATLHQFSTGTQNVQHAGDTGWRELSADLSAYAGQTVRVLFRQHVPQTRTGAAQFELDDIGFAASSTTDSLVRNYVSATGGTYTVRCTGADTDYNLVVYRNSDLGQEDDGSIATANPVGSAGALGRQWSSGHVDGDNGDASDFYEVHVAAGGSLNVFTHTPGGADGAFLNDLDPFLRLYDSAGTLLAEDDSSGARGRDAILSYTATADETLYIEVLASPATGPTSGAYVLSVIGNQ